MALTDQPYFPLYQDDYLSDEKLNQCDPESEGIYIRIMCNMHKSKTYGILELSLFDKAKLKQKISKIEASQEQKQLISSLGFLLEDFFMMVLKVQSLVGRDTSCVLRSLIDLLGNDVLQFDGVLLTQKRMKNDGEVSKKRADAGKKGGNSKNKKEAKLKQIPVNENVVVNDFDNKIEITNNKKSKKFQIPTVEEIKNYCQERENRIDSQKFYDFYQGKGWMIGKNKMKDWKACVRTWERNDNSNGNSSQINTDDDNR
jgi:hypothetical protein